MRYVRDGGNFSVVASSVFVRLLLATLVSIPMATLCGERLVHAMLPALAGVFEWVSGDFKLLRLAIDQEGADRVLRATVMWKHVMVIGGHVIYPDPRGTANASTLLAHALQGPLVAILAALAWPVRQWAVTVTRHSLRPWLEWTFRAVALLPLLAILVLLDMPIVLAGELWDLALGALDPGATSILVIWKQFMQGGGRYALGAATGLLALLLARSAAQFVDRRWARVPRSTSTASAVSGGASS